MNSSFYIEAFGYLGSFLVVVSMLMTSVVKLRIINTIGSIISGTYALVIGSFPLALMNACLIIINFYNLVKLLKVDQKYSLFDGHKNESFFRYLIEHYYNDIEIFFPKFNKTFMECDMAYIVCCNANPVGIFLGNKKSENEIEIVLDYSTPVYRDCSVAKYLYGELAKKGIVELYFEGASKKHEQYLKKMGYRKVKDVYVKKL